MDLEAKSYGTMGPGAMGPWAMGPGEPRGMVGGAGGATQSHGPEEALGPCGLEAGPGVIHGARRGVEGGGAIRDRGHGGRAERGGSGMH